MKAGVISVTETKIVVRTIECDGMCEQRCETEMPRTVEGMLEAARILADDLDIPFDDVAMECRRVHRRDQFSAVLRDAIEKWTCEAKP